MELIGHYSNVFVGGCYLIAVIACVKTMVLLVYEPQQLHVALELSIS